MITSKWKDTKIHFPSEIFTMISAEEKQYLYWLARTVWQGKGLVVEIGPWLGGSTWCLAAGMHDSGYRADKRLVVYDNFIWRDFMSERAPIDISPGDCFQAHFMKNISRYESIVDAYKRTLPDEIIYSDKDAQSKRYVEDENVEVFSEVAGSAPVELLFVDGAKSWLGLRHLLVSVSDRLIPGHSLLVCQDFKYWGTYWVPLMLTFLGKYLQPVHNVMTATTVAFRLTNGITQNDLVALASHIADVPTEDALAAIDEAADYLVAAGDILGSAHVRLGKVMFLCHQNQVDRAALMFRESQAHWPRIMNTNQLERARKYLAESRSTYVAPPLAARAIQPALRAARAAKRTAKRMLRRK
jgi:hypothetical protein